PGGADRYFTRAGLTLTAKVAPITVDFAGYLGALAWWEVQGGHGPTMTTPMLVGRRYTMQAYFSTGLNDSSDVLSLTNAGIAVSLDGTTVTPDAGGADRYFTASGRTLTAKTVPVTVDFNGYSGNLTWTEIIGARGPTMTTPMLVGRRYSLQAYYSVGPNDTSPVLT